MKKLLFASTALIASAGIAAADVSVSGDARMGVIYNSAGGLGTDLQRNWAFTNRIRITFNASGETSTGLTFGGSVRARHAAAAEIAGNQGEVFVDGAFGKLSMGDVDSGDKAVTQDLHNVGLTLLRPGLNYAADGDFGLATLVNAPARVLYEYDMDGFSFAASHSQTGNVRSMGVGAGYSMAGFEVGLGFGEARNSNANARTRDITATAGYSMGDFGVRAVAQRETSTLAGNQTDRTNTLGLSGSASFDMVEVTAYAVQMQSSAAGTARSMGLGGEYDLGGGASLKGGIARNRAPGGATNTVADFGVNLSF